MSGFTDDIPVDRHGGSLVKTLASAQHLPADALALALLHPDRIAEPVLRILDAAGSDQALDPDDQNLLFWGMHVLGAAQDTRLFKPLLALARRPDDASLELFGDAVMTTLPRLLIGSFDGDVGALTAAVMDGDAEEHVRLAFWGTLSYLTFSSRIDRDVAHATVVSFEAERPARAGDMAWNGWEETIALLGFADLAEKVAAARQDANILDDLSDPEWFAETLADALANPQDGRRFEEAGLGPIVDLVAELDAALVLDDEQEPEPVAPVVNPLRKVGRNDPCPCGSGLKYKKCCIDKAA